ncbi:ABC transporter permease [Bacillus thuringiensis]|uniref:ABC3 transporter permease C-terminal domain-containing protein n=1 Tax=Bacillus thuringiensis subsp. jegathesan TaxID=56955 RepID=A0A9X6QXR2_BACTJ|nr:ABC transporter permease [Bacillus thuringiensis]OUB63549.1 hypothetical protein BK750_20195 [Bacillus thuringiensis serovar jegathesan]
MRIKRKRNIENVILSVFMIFTTLMTMMITSYFVKKSEIDILTNELYSQSSIHFRIEDEKTSEKFRGFIKETTDSNYILFKENMNESFIKGVYLNDSIKNIPMKKGRFFEKNDFFQDKKYAVIGKSFKNVESINGKNYINYKGDRFEVIGIIGGEVKSKVDEMAYVNLDALFNTDFNFTGIYVLDSQKHPQIIFKKLKSYLTKENLVSQIENQGKGTSRLIEHNWTKNIVLFFILIIIFIMNILFSGYWIYKKKIQISIQHMIGDPALQIYILLFRKYIFISITSYFVAIGLFSIFNASIYVNYLYIYIQIVTLGLIYIILFGGILFILSSFIYSSKNCMKVLKSN